MLFSRSKILLLQLLLQLIIDTGEASFGGTFGPEDRDDHGYWNCDYINWFKRVYMCKNGARCINDPWLQYVYWCVCTPGWTGKDCDIDIKECNSIPCQNGGTCTEKKKASYECSCLGTGFAGKRCETNVNDCIVRVPYTWNEWNEALKKEGLFFPWKYRSEDVCKNGATCTDGINEYKCNCRPGYTGKNCQIEINECASHPCQYGATCKDLVNGYACLCKQNFDGANCEDDVNTCRFGGCWNGGTCINGINSYQCRCAPGFEGADCRDDVNTCRFSKCWNGATCINGINTHQCRCAPGFQGEHCRDNVEECASVTCLNNGYCVDQVNDFKCQCLALFTGTLCETEMERCLQDECIHGDCGVIHRCDCNLGYTGAHCESALCKEEFCLECNEDGIGCNACRETRTGTNCESELCDPLTCEHGECRDDLLTCECDKDYTGPKCETRTLAVRIEGYAGPVKDGEQLALQCVPTYEKKEFRFYWAFTPADGGNISYIGHSQNLSIEEVKPEHAGNYFCSNIYVLSDTLTVVVTEKEEEPISLGRISFTSSKPVIGVSSVLLIMFLTTVSYIVWKRRESQRKTEDTGAHDDIILDDIPDIPDIPSDAEQAAAPAFTPV